MEYECLSEIYPKDYGNILNEQLPTDVYDKGVTFRYIEIHDISHSRPYKYRRCDYVLIDRAGWELFKWNYNPTQGELWDKCRELKLMEMM